MKRFLIRFVIPFLIGAVVGHVMFVGIEYISRMKIAKVCDSNGEVELNGIQYICFAPHPDVLNGD